MKWNKEFDRLLLPNEILAHIIIIIIIIIAIIIIVIMITMIMLTLTRSPFLLRLLHTSSMSVKRKQCTSNLPPLPSLICK